MKRRKLHGFTLIELLVVIAIISLLVSILLPSLNSAKELARAVICRSNMKQIGLAMTIYATEENDEMPPSMYSHRGISEFRSVWDTRAESVGGNVPIGLGYLVTSGMLPSRTPVRGENRPEVLRDPISDQLTGWRIHNDWVDYVYGRDTSTIKNGVAGLGFGKSFSELGDHMISYCLAAGLRGDRGEHMGSANFLFADSTVRPLEWEEDYYDQTQFVDFFELVDENSY